MGEVKRVHLSAVEKEGEIWRRRGEKRRRNLCGYGGMVTSAVDIPLLSFLGIKIRFWSQNYTVEGPSLSKPEGLSLLWRIFFARLANFLYKISTLSPIYGRLLPK